MVWYAFKLAQDEEWDEGEDDFSRSEVEGYLLLLCD